MRTGRFRNHMTLRRAVGALATSLIVLACTAVPALAGNIAEVYRLHNPNTGEHLYTTSAYERDSLARSGWNSEGIGWYAPTTGSVVYRLANPYNGKHSFTASEVERNNLLSHGWQSEGVGFCTSSTTVVPIYRIEQGDGNNLFTESEYEASVVAGTRRGTAFYAAGYHVRYDANGGSPTPGGQTVGYGYDFQISGTRPYKAGWTFQNWGGHAPGSWTKNLTDNDGETVTLWANYSPNSVRVTFNGNGGTIARNGTQTFTSGWGQSFADTGAWRSGYTLLGWADNPWATTAQYSTLSGVADGWIGGGGSRTLYAVWSKNSYTFDVNPDDNRYGTSYETGARVKSFDMYKNGRLVAGGASDYYVQDAQVGDRYELRNVTYRNGYHYLRYDLPGYRSGGVWDWRSGGWAEDGGRAINVTMGGDALWLSIVTEPNRYTVRYDGNGATRGATADSTHTYDAEGALNANGYAREGYDFAGWNTKADGSGTAYADRASVRNLTDANGGTVTLFAQWKAHTYTIRYDANGGAGTVEEQRNIAYDGSVTLASGGFEREGHALKSWNTKADGSGRAFGLGEVTSMVGGQSRDGETVTLYAQWAKAPTIHRVKAVQEEAKRFLIYAYVTEDGSGIDRVQFPTWSSEGGQDDIQQDWQTSAAARGEQGDWTIGHEKYNWRYEVRPEDHKGGLGSYNTVVHAYGKNGEVTTKSLSYGFAFTISYQLDGGLVEGNPEGYSPEQDDFTLINPTRRGHTFLGWTGSNGDVPSREVTIKKGTTGDLRYRARWAVNDYTLRFDANGGAGAPEDFGFAYGTRPNITDAKPTRAGYDFVEWNTRPDGSGASLEAGGTIPNEWRDMTVYAQWEAHSATVTYDANCGSWKGRLPSPAETHVGEATRIADATLARLGATMTGWNTRADGRGRSYKPGASVTWDTDEDVTLYAQWRGERCVIRYDANGGVGRTPDTWYEGTGPTKVVGSGFSRDGWDFVGWNTAANGSGTAYRVGQTVSVDTLGREEVILFAQWRARGCTVRFDGYGGTSPASAYRSLGDPYGELPTSTRAGCTFAGWYTKPVGGAKVSPSDTVPVGSITLYAHWVTNRDDLPDHLVNGDFEYPSGNFGTGPDPLHPELWDFWYSDATGIGGWVNGRGPLPATQKLFGWTSDQKDNGWARDHSVEVQQDVECGNKFGEIVVEDFGVAIYQDIRTEPGAVYHWSLAHTSVASRIGTSFVAEDSIDLGFIDKMSVMIGSPDDVRAQVAKRIRSNGQSMSVITENTPEAGDQNQVGWTSTVIETPAKHGSHDGPHHGSISDQGSDWDLYEGCYLVPEGQYVTRFTYKSLESKVANGGNHVDGVTFETKYPLFYDANGGMGNLPQPYVDPSTATMSQYYRSGEKVGILSASQSVSQCKVSKTEDGHPLTLLGWSTKPLPTVRTKADYDAAMASIVSTYTIRPTGEGNVVYAVWARQPEVRFHTQTPDVPDPTTQVLSQVYLPSGAKAGRAVDPGWDTSKPFAGRAGWYFGGWFTDPGCTSAFDFSSDIWQDTDLYAKWYRAMYVRFNYSADSYIQKDTDQRELGIKDAKGKEIRLPSDLAVREGARTLLPTMPMAYGSYSRIVDSGVRQDYDVALTPVGWSTDPEHATDPFGNDLVNERQRLQAPWYDDVGSPYVDVYVKYSPYLFDGVTAYH